MKKVLILLIIIIYIIGCTTHKEFITQNNICFMDEAIRKEEKNLNINKSIDSILAIGEVELMDNDTLNSTLYKHPTYGTITNKKTNKKTGIDKMLIYEEGKLIGSYFQYQGGLLSIGKEIEYDQNGNITKIIDHDKGYKICWAQAIEIVKHKRKNELAKYDAVSFILGRVDLEKFPDEKPVWSVGIDPEPDNTIGETIYHKVDGVTGKYLGKYKVTMVHD